MVYYICIFKLMNIIKNFYIICQQESHFPCLQRLSNLLDIGERECVYCITQHSKQWYSVLFKSRIKIIDMLGKIVFKSYIKQIFSFNQYLMIFKLSPIPSLKVNNCFSPIFSFFLGSFSQMESQTNLLAVMWVIQWRTQSWCEFMAIGLSCQSIEMRK